MTGAKCSAPEQPGDRLAAREGISAGGQAPRSAVRRDPVGDHAPRRAPDAGRQCDPRPRREHAPGRGERLPRRTRAADAGLLRHPHLRRQMDGDGHGGEQLPLAHLPGRPQPDPADGRLRLPGLRHLGRGGPRRRVQQRRGRPERLDRQPGPLRRSDQPELPRDRSRPGVLRRLDVRLVLGRRLRWHGRCPHHRPALRPRLPRRLGGAEPRPDPRPRPDDDPGRRAPEHRVPRLVPRQSGPAGDARHRRPPRCRSPRSGLGLDRPEPDHRPDHQLGRSGPRNGSSASRKSSGRRPWIRWP